MILASVIYGFFVTLLRYIGVSLGAMYTAFMAGILLLLGYKFAELVTKGISTKRKEKNELKNTTDKELIQTTDTIIKTNHTITSNKNSSDTKVDVEKTSNKKGKYCKKCGSLIDSKSKKCTGCNKQYFKLRISKNIVFIALLFLIILSSIGINLYLWMFNNSLQDDIKEKEEAISNLRADYNSLLSDKASLESDNIRQEQENEDIEDAYDFYKEYCAIVYDDGSNLYHTYNCPDVKPSDYEFWI